MYVDDMVTKSNSEEEMLADIEESFANLHIINMKLNPTKCNFSIEEVKFLGFMVTQGHQNQSEEDQRSNKNVVTENKKQVHNLNDKLAVLNRFLSKATDLSLPFSKVLKDV